jgi:hypothetical protein
MVQQTRSSIFHSKSFNGSIFVFLKLETQLALAHNYTKICVFNLITYVLLGGR